MIRVFALSLFLGLSSLGELFAADPAVSVSRPAVSLDEASLQNEAGVRVALWYAENVPTVIDQELRLAGAARFLRELKIVAPREWETVSQGGNDEIKSRKSLLLRCLALEATRPEWSKSRSELATRRLHALWNQKEGREASDSEVEDVLQKLKAVSDIYHRRLVEGKMDDEDLWTWVRKFREPKSPTSTERASRESSVSELLADYLRRNQEGATLARVRSYQAEYELTTHTGATQRLLVIRLRPDFFRLHVFDQQGLSLIIAGGDRGFWQWGRNSAPMMIERESVVSREFLNRFLDPLFNVDPSRAQRLSVQEVRGRSCERIQVRQETGVATFAFAQDTGELLERESVDGTRVAYSEHAMVAGIRLPHREETIDANGRKGVLVLKKLTLNPGVFSGFFAPPQPGDFDLFALQRQWALAMKKKEGSIR